MPGSSQKFIARNRAPRVQIEYDVEVYGAEKKVQLPFVMGVMADLAGKSEVPQPAIQDRKFLEIDVDNFDARMKAMAPRATFTVPNTLTGEGNLAVDLTFEGMDDFSPAAIARKVAPLAALLEARTQLANLTTYMDGKAGAEALLEKVLQDTSLLSALASGAVAPDARTAALDALRATAPDPAAPQPDPSAAALAALRAKAPVEAPVPPDAAANALAALRAAAPVEAPVQPDAAANALAALRAAAPVEAPVQPDAAANALAALRAVAPGPSAPAPDTAADALAALRAAAPIVSAQLDDAAAAALAALREAVPDPSQAPDADLYALAALRAVAPGPSAPAPDTAADALAALRAAAPIASTQVDDAASAALAALREAVPDPSRGPDAAADALAALRAVAPGPSAPAPDTAADALAALRAAAPIVSAQVDDTAAAALAALREAVPDASRESDAAADALAALRAVAPGDLPQADDAAANALAALRAAGPASPQSAPDAAAEALAALRAAGPAPAQVDDAATDTLAALRAGAPTGMPQADDTTADALAALRAAIPDAPQASDAAADALAALRAGARVDSPEADATADALAALRAASPVTPQPAEADALAALRAAAPVAAVPPDPLAGLADLLAPPAAAEDDPLAGLDDLFAEPAAAAAPPATAGQADPSVSDDPLSGLDDLLAPPEAAAVPAADDALAGLDDLLAPPPVAVAADPLAGLDDLLTVPEAAPPPPLVAADPLAGLDDLLSPPEAAPPPPPPVAEDPLAGLDDLLAPPPVAEDDPLAGLDDLLDPPAAPPPPPVEDDPLAALDALLAAPAEAPAAAPDDPLADLDALLAPPPPPPPAPPRAATPAAPAAAARKETTVSASFGRLTAPAPSPEALRRPVFRLAILGDFSGRAARGALEIGDALADRRAIRFDIDTVEKVIAGFAQTLVLPIGDGAKGISVELDGIDSLHPDELVENLSLFDEMKGLRQRLSAPAMAAKAVAEMQAWASVHKAPPLPTSNRSAGNAVPADLKLSDFQRLIGDREGRLSQPSPAADLIGQVVGPYVVAGPNPQAAALKASLDDAMSATMRLVLHHPEFQAIEAQWRALDLLARRIETDAKFQLTLFDISAEEVAADLSVSDDLERSGLFRLLNAPLTEEGGIGFSAFCGLYTFEETPPHAELLGRLGRIAQHVQAPAFVAMSPAHIDLPREDRHPLVARAWEKLRQDPVAGWLGIATPRFLLRRPYGERSEPIDAFDFEEFSMSEGLAGLLWGNPVVLVAILLAEAWQEGKGKVVFGKTMSVGDLPFIFAPDRHGDQVQLPCTERNLTTEKMERVVSRGFMPLVSIRGRDVVRLASFQSLAGAEILGPWSGEQPAADSPAPEPALTMQVPTGAASVDADLDALLAGFASTPAAPADPGSVDADLAALLEGL